MSNQRKIRNLLLMPSVQLKYIFSVVFVILTLALIAGWIIYNSLSENYELFSGLMDFSEAIQFQLKSEFNNALFLLVGAGIGLSLSAGLFMLILTHKVVGHVYHLDKFLQSLVREKKLRAFKIRKTDEFQSLAKSVNELIQFLKQQNTDLFLDVKDLVPESEKDKLNNIKLKYDIEAVKQAS